MADTTAESAKPKTTTKRDVDDVAAFVMSFVQQQAA